MVLTEEQKTDIYPVATMETARLAIEQGYYSIEEGQIVDHSTVSGLPAYANDNGIGNNPSDPSFEAAPSQKLYRLNGNSAKTGLGITLKVMAGDRLDIFGKSYYNQNNTGGSGANVAPSILSILEGFLGGPSGGIAAGVHGGVTAAGLNGLPATTSGIASLLSSHTSSNTSNDQRPKAFINYLFFDERMQCVGTGFSGVGVNGQIKDHFGELQNIVVPKNGFVYIYVSNESPVDVFFDNLQVVHKRSPILEETHYYPFGLTMAGISSKAAGGIQNRLKFNGGNELQNAEFSDGSGMELYDAVNRMYDPQLGRFWQVDEFAEGNFEWTPYNYGINNPIRFNDPFGLKEGDPNDPKVLENVTVVGVKGLWAKTRLYYELMDRTKGDLSKVVNNSLREQMYRIDGIVRHRERVAEMTRAGDKIFLETASWFMPAGYLTKLRHLKYAANLFKLKRGGRVTLVAQKLIARNTSKEMLINGTSDLVSQTINNTVKYVNDTDPNKGGYFSYVAGETNLLSAAGNTIFKNPITTSIISTVGDGDIRALPGNLLGDAIGVIPISKTLGSGFQDGASFTMNLWGNQVGNTVTNIVKPEGSK